MILFRTNRSRYTGDSPNRSEHVTQRMTEQRIGIGARVAPGPLPHHLACGSALGDSALCSKLRPDRLTDSASRVLQECRRECLMHRLTGREHPRPLAAHTVGKKASCSAMPNRTNHVLQSSGVRLQRSGCRSRRRRLNMVVRRQRTSACGGVLFALCVAVSACERGQDQSGIIGRI